MNQQAIDILDEMIAEHKKAIGYLRGNDIRYQTAINAIEEVKSRIQALGDGRTDEEIIFDIKSDIYSLQRKYNDFELSQAYDGIANFKLPPNK